MSVTVEVEIRGKRRVWAAQDLPLSVGGASCHLALPELAAESVAAFLGEDADELFIQPCRDAGVPITCNGVRLSASRWLASGDEVGIGRHRLRCETSGGSPAK